MFALKVFIGRTIKRRKSCGVQVFPGNALEMRPMEILCVLKDMKGNTHASWLLSVEFQIRANAWLDVIALFPPSPFLFLQAFLHAVQAWRRDTVRAKWREMPAMRQQARIYDDACICGVCAAVVWDRRVHFLPFSSRVVSRGKRITLGLI